MADINLLPWRAQRRQQRQRAFYVQLLLACLGAVLLVLLWSHVMTLRINSQNSRNAYLEHEIRRLDQPMKKLNALESAREQLLQRQHVTEALQARRWQLVQLFEAIAITIPAGVRLTRLQQQGGHLRLSGQAASNADVAQFMQQLAALPWPHAPELQQTMDMHDGTVTPYRFELVMHLAENGEDGADE